jgi:Fe-S-cluster containining protein
VNRTHGPTPSPHHLYRIMETRHSGMKASKPVPADPPTPDEIARQTARFRALIAKPTRERLRTLVSACHRQLDQTIAANPPRQEIACRKGCAHCCHLYVSATAPELLAIAEHVSKWPEERRAGLIERLDRALQVTRGLSPVERVRLSHPCPMLEDGLCSIYPVRPLGCRAYASFDVAACERSTRERDAEAPIPVPRINMRNRRFLSHCLRAALTERGLDGNSYELVAGLSTILNTPDADTRWADGESILADVQTDP